MNVQRLRYFIVAAQCASFTEAAERLYTTQPNLSRQIAQLEEEIGGPLFQRSKKRVVLTPVGQMIYDRLYAVPDVIDQTFDLARAYIRGEEGQLAVGVLEGLDISQLLSAGASRLRADSAAGVLLERDSFKGLRDGLGAYRYDVIITLSFELHGLKNVESLTLHRQRGAIAIQKNHPKAGLKHPTLADFRDEPFLVISPEQSPGGHEQLIRQCEDAGFVPRIVLEASNSGSMLLSVETGQGVTLLDMETSRLINSANVALLPLPDSDYVDLVAVWQGDNANPLVPRLIESMQASTGQSEERPS